MITGTSASFTTVVEGADRPGCTWRMLMTLPAGPYSDVTLAVESIDIDASTTSDMPEGTRLQVGYPAMSCTFTLSGLVDQTDETKTAAWLFSPYSTTSPLYQKDALYAPVTVDFGWYTAAAAGTTTQGTPEYVRKFTGLVDSIVVNDDGTVTFSCLEKIRQQLRGTATLPVVATLGAAIVGDPTVLQPVTAEYVIDAVLRSATAGTISTWPATRGNAVFAMGWRASNQPEVGFQFGDSANWNPNRISFKPGIWGSAATITNTALDMDPANSATNCDKNAWHLSSSILLVNNSSQFILEGWVTGATNGVRMQISGTDDASEVHTLSVSYEPSVSKFRVNFKDGATDHIQDLTSPVVDDAPHYLALTGTITQTSGNLSLSNAAVWWDGSVMPVVGGLLGGTATGTTTLNKWQFNLGPSATMEAVQVAVGSSGPNASFTPAAVLDPSLNPIQVVPATAGDPYQVIQQIVDAELGVAGGDEAGVFRFYNRDTIANATSSRDITSATSLTAVGGIETPAAAIRNRCTIEYQTWDVANAATVVYSETSPIKIPRGQAVVLTPPLDPAAIVQFNVSSRQMAVTPDGLGVTGIGNYYRASTDKAGTAEYPQITSVISQPSPIQAMITFRNTGTKDAWLVSPATYLDLPAGTPLMKVAGWVLEQQASASADIQYPPADSGGAASTRFGEIAHQITGNQWIQDVTTAGTLAVDIVDDLCTPRPNLTAVAITPDPRLQLIDVVHIRDPDRTFVDDYARIFGWHITWQPGQFTMTIDARTLAAPGGWIMGFAGRSEVGSTAYVYPST